MIRCVRLAPFGYAVSHLSVFTECTWTPLTSIRPIWDHMVLPNLSHVASPGICMCGFDLNSRAPARQTNPKQFPNCTHPQTYDNKTTQKIIRRASTPKYPPAANPAPPHTTLRTLPLATPCQHIPGRPSTHLRGPTPLPSSCHTHPAHSPHLNPETLGPPRFQEKESP